MYLLKASYVMQILTTAPGYRGYREVVCNVRFVPECMRWWWCSAARNVGHCKSDGKWWHQELRRKSLHVSCGMVQECSRNDYLEIRRRLQTGISVDQTLVMAVWTDKIWC